MSIYGIFENKKTNKKLVYYPCAKNANSSAKLFFIKHADKEDKVYFIDDTVPIHNRNLYSEIERDMKLMGVTKISQLSKKNIRFR